MKRIAVAAIAILLPRIALACACCADRGQRSESNRAGMSLAEAFEQLGAKATVAASEAEPGLLVPISGDDGASEFSAYTKVEGESAVLTIVAGKKSGTLVFKADGAGTHTAIDLDPFGQPEESVSLYHEDRHPMIFRGTGLLAGKSGSATLVLQGRSNSCPPEHYDTWHLSLKTKDEEVELYGRAKADAAKPTTP